MTNGTRPAAVRLVMYGRGACHLCDDMRAALEELQSTYDFTVEFRDIDSKTEWHDKYALKIPVLMAGSTEICHFHLDPVSLKTYFSELM